MSLTLQVDKLQELMESFYTVTHIKIAIFDENYKELLAYPKQYCRLCTLMQSSGHTRMACDNSNVASFEACKKSKQLLIYHCHAGLVEATAPLLDNGVIIGYLMFGQITDNKNKAAFTSQLREICERYGLPQADYAPAIQQIKYRNHTHIRSSAKILEACIYYVLLHQLVSNNKEHFTSRLTAFIDQHIHEDIPVSRLCEVFSLSRTRLYELSAGLPGAGLADYIKNKRIEHAKRLLKESDHSVTVIAEMVGFSDYNYFCRVFKKQAGQSARAFRKG